MKSKKGPNGPFLLPMKQYIFKNGIIFNIYHEKEYCETVFPDGKKVPAVPEPNDPPFAKECGYEERVWDLNWHHEFIHNWLAEQRGQRYSPVLRYVAEGNVGETEWSGREENEVISIQRWINNVGIRPFLANNQGSKSGLERAESGGSNKRVRGINEEKREDDFRTGMAENKTDQRMGKFNGEVQNILIKSIQDRVITEDQLESLRKILKNLEK